MLTPAAKRRRRAAEVATATLTRPFRSPVIRGGRDGRAAAPAASPERHHKRRQDIARSPSKDGVVAAAPQESSKAGAEKGQAPESGLEPPEQDTAAMPGSLAELVQDFLVDLDAGDRSLAAAVRAAENRSSPAARNTTSTDGDDDSLPALIARWREAARMAADEVFSQVAERVARAGGVKAWRAMMRGDGWGADRAGERGDDARRRGSAEDGQDERSGSEDGREDRDPEHGGDGDEEEEEEEEHAGFTMSMMLASLRVEPGLLGYNEAEERWED